VRFKSLDFLTKKIDLNQDWNQWFKSVNPEVDSAFYHQWDGKWQYQLSGKVVRKWRRWT